jgi:diguanylate cyclase (GGDEF)-like protein/PAS domain S-box-containing protein
MTDPSTHILLLEDNPGDVMLLRAALDSQKNFPCRLETWPRLSDGLEHLSRDSFDAVLLDLYLPDSSGIPTLSTIHMAAPQLPIVVLTGLNDRETALRALREGAEDYLLKDDLEGPLLIRTIRYALERHKLLTELQENEERYHLVARGANDGLWDWDLRSNRSYFSPRWKELLGHSGNEVGDDPQEWFARIHPKDFDRVQTDLKRHLLGKTSHYANEHRIRHKDGRYRWFLTRGSAIFDPQGRPLRIAGSFTDVSRHKDLEQQLALRAFYDPLTGLPNRTFFMESLGRAYARSRRTGGLFSVLFMDLDRLKAINDQMGHRAGDLLLVEFAKRLRACVRPQDIAARLGGDEFTVLLEDLVRPVEACDVARRILMALKEPFLLEGHDASSSVSIGIAFSGPEGPGPDGILKEADAAMYRAKTKGKGRYEVQTGPEGSGGEGTVPDGL